MESRKTIGKAYSTAGSKELYWISMTCKPRPAGGLVRGRLFSLTISLVNFQEDNIKNGVRLMVVDKSNYESDLYGFMMVDEWRDATKIRQRLRVERRAISQMRLSSFQASGTKAELDEYNSAGPLIIPLKCIFEGPWSNGDWILRPFRSNDLDQQNSPKIIFDRVYRPVSRNRTLTIILDLQTDEYNDARCYHLEPADDIFLSITRHSTSRPPAPALPADVISSIAAYALLEYRPFSSEWSETIFSLGVINSSWVHIFDIRWALLGTNRNDIGAFCQFKSATFSLKRGLSARAISSIKGFDIGRFKVPWQKEGKPPFHEFAAALIKSSNCLLYLHINAEIFLMVADSLAKQQQIEKFEITRASDSSVISLPEVCKAIQSWTQLKSLTLLLGRYFVERLKSERDNLSRHFEPIESNSTSLYLLEELCFSYEFIPGNQLSAVVPASRERLRRLFVHRTAGLSTRDLAAFFALTYSTLEELQIFESDIEQCITEDSDLNYEYPLDAWVDKMPRLQLVMVPGTVASILSISRKGRVDPEYIREGLVCDGPSPFIMIEFGRPNTPRDFNPPWLSGDSEFLVSAINQSCWGRVRISLATYSPFSVADTAWKEAVRAAKKKGMRLSIDGAGLSLYSSKVT